jgi:DNA polymerase III delta subunit
MLTIIHGDDTDASYKELTKLRAGMQATDVRVLDGKGLTAAELTSALQSSSLFGGEVSIVIERLLSSINKKSKDWSELVTIINTSVDTADVLLYETKELDKTTLGKFGKNMTVHSFMVPRIIFEFLDGLHSGNATESLVKFQTIVAHDPAEIVFAMIVKRFRHLIQLTDGITPDGLAPWQAGRLTRQARFFTMEKLVSMYKKLAAIELAVKTGTSPFTLSKHINQFILAL